MFYSVLYLGLMCLGYALGVRLRSTKPGMRLVEPIVNISISLLIMTIGIKMGSNNRIIDELGSISVAAVIYTITLWFAAVISVKILKKITNISERFTVTENLEEISGDEKKNDGIDLTQIIVVSLLAGLFVGFFFVRTQIDQESQNIVNDVISGLVVVDLSVMIFVIGYNMGLEGTAIKQFKKEGITIIFLPVAILIGTAAGSVILGLIMTGITLKESVAIGFGFGWYTYAPIVIANGGHEIASAISFMHNVFREVGGLILIPMLAEKIGCLESTALPGAGAMDVGLPILRASGGYAIIPYAVSVGLSQVIACLTVVPWVAG